MISSRSQGTEEVFCVVYLGYHTGSDIQIKKGSLFLRVDLFSSLEEYKVDYLFLDNCPLV